MIELITMFWIIWIFLQNIIAYGQRKKMINISAEISNQQLEIIDKIELIRINTNNVARNTYNNKMSSNKY